MKYNLGKRLASQPGPALITGHTGFKGTWLTLLLESLGIPVVGFSLPPEKDSLFEMTEREGLIPEKFSSILDRASFLDFITETKPTTVFHLAAQPLIIKSYEDPLETFEINALGTATILDACSRISSIKGVLVSTTDKVYKNDDSYGYRFIESDQLGAVDPYSGSKVAAEAAISIWQKLQSNYSLVSARAGNVIGGGDVAKDRLIPDLVRAMMSNGQIEIRNINSTRPWQHVIDPLIGYIVAIEKMLEGVVKVPAFNFGPVENGMEVKHVVELFKNTYVGDLKIHNPTKKSSNVVEKEFLQISSNLAKDTLGWHPVWNQKEAIEMSAYWWKSVNRGIKSPLEATMFDIATTLKKLEKEDLNDK